MASYPITIRTNGICIYYHFEIFEKGFQVKYEKDNNSTRQYFPFTQILTVRLDYSWQEKENTLWIMLKDGLKYSYCLKCQGDAESIYEAIRNGI